MHTPVLLIVFNRPDTTARVFEAIRLARPERLYVAADGPRAGREGEAALCAQARQVATAVDWPCEIKTRFLDHNQGCKRAVSGAITWLFECEPEGIILEDDCLPHPTFFPYCEALLEKYRDTPRVMSIAGTPPGTHPPVSHSFVFSKYARIWGWASWRRAWRLYDVNMAAWPAFRTAHGLRKLSQRGATFELKWQGVFDATHQGKIDTWDFQWLFAHWLNDGLACLPAVNLVKNIGFRPDGTHTSDPDDAEANRPTQPMALPLTYPDDIALDPDFDIACEGGLRPLTIGRWFRMTPVGQRLVSMRRALVGS